MQTDGDYLYQRAERELAMAARATLPEAMKAHYTLANLYLDRFYQLGSDRRRPDEKIVI